MNAKPFNELCRRAHGLRLAVFTLALLASLAAQAARLPQRVLYVGDRASEFVPFLKKHFVEAQSESRAEFQPAWAKEFDVVVLDWPQSDASRIARLDGSPLGKREEWNRPTVLLGSAGLNLAVAWKLKGGSGCTCLSPIAHGVQDHEIFRSPNKIDIKAHTVNAPTPHTFAHEIKEPTTDLVPLIDGITNFDTANRDRRPGWASHYYEFADMPEVELFSGGVNDQTPRSAAFWRQGNLLHFGFEQSPKELNETGCAMLVNAIVYISRFTEDRPIDITLSVFGAEPVGVSRKRVKRYLTDPEIAPDTAQRFLAPAALATFASQDRAAANAWFDANGAWLHPIATASNLLELDIEARALGTPFDAPDFLPKTIQALRDDKTRAAAVTLLGRYVANGPAADAGPVAWDKWWKENGPYLFYSELGGYQWYVDPLAKKRGIPTKDLRGPARADQRR